MLFWKPIFNFITPLKLDQTLIFKNHIDILVSYHFSEIEIEQGSDPEPQVGNFISLLTQ